MSNVGKLIRNYRLGAEMSQAKLAKKIGGVSHAFISKIECGKAKLPKKKVIKIGRILKIPELAMRRALKMDFENGLDF